MFSAWEQLLDTTEEDSCMFLELANNLVESISLELLAHTARKKLLFKKVRSVLLYYMTRVQFLIVTCKFTSSLLTTFLNLLTYIIYLYADIHVYTVYKCVYMYTCTL